MKAIVYNTKDKTACLVSCDLAKAMLFMGNPHGFNRATEFPDSGINQIISVMESNGYKVERGAQ